MVVLFYYHLGCTRSYTQGPQHAACGPYNFFYSFIILLVTILDPLWSTT